MCFLFMVIGLFGSVLVVRLGFVVTFVFGFAVNGEGVGVVVSATMMMIEVKKESAIFLRLRLRASGWSGPAGGLRSVRSTTVVSIYSVSSGRSGGCSSNSDRRLIMQVLRPYPRPSSPRSKRGRDAKKYRPR